MNKEQYKKYCEILCVSEDATVPEIKESYKTLISILHPDKHQSSDKKMEKAEIKTKELNEAYTALLQAKAKSTTESGEPEFDQSAEEIVLTNEQYLVSQSKKFSQALWKIIELDSEFINLDSSNLITNPIKEVKTGKYSFKPTSLLGTIYKISDPVPIIRYDLENHDEIASAGITIKDRQDDEIICLPVDFGKFQEKYSEIVKSKGVLRFTGFIISIDGKGYYFYLKQISSNLTALDIIGLKPERKEAARAKFEEANKYPDGIRAYIKKELVKNLSITGLDKAIELNKAIDFMILQSFSFGMADSGNYTNKLHSLVIGSPAVGKKLLSIIASILNPVAYELSSAKAKLTTAGLIGSVVKKGKDTISNAGYLPLASGGIICIQDFHELARGKGTASSLMATLAQVMEDGKVIDSTSAKTVHKAITSIHVDMNRLSQVIPGKKFTAYDDIPIPTNVLSRFDFVIEIPKNAETQMEVAKSMIDRWDKFGNLYSDNEKPPEWIRDLKVIVGFITSNFRSTEISAEVKQYADDKLKDLNESYSSENTSSEDMSDVSTRLVNSIAKYAKAITCSKYEPKVLKADIDEAFSFIDYKMKFLANREPEPEAQKIGVVERRCQIMVERYANRIISIKAITNDWNSTPELIPVDIKTISRAMKRLVENGQVEMVEHGKYLISPEDDDS